MRSVVTANTTPKSRKTPMLMRSQTPSQGIGRFAESAGASRNVNKPNTTRTAMLATE
jgi:hypothetical protein